MIDREKIITALECCKDVHQSGRWASGCISCGYADKNRPDCFLSLADDAAELLKEQEEKIRQLESMNVSASGNGTAIGVVKGGLVIQKGQNNKHIVNNGTMTMTFGK